jgi:hypothetical protein
MRNLVLYQNHPRFDPFYYVTMEKFVRYANGQLNIVKGRDYHIIAADNGPRILNVTLAVRPNLLLKLTRAATELSMSMGLPKNFTIRIVRGHGPQVCLEIPKPQYLCFDITDGFVDNRVTNHKPHTSSIGVTASGQVVSVDFNDPLQAHILIAGTTGSGKTVAQKMVVWGLTKTTSPRDLRITVLDVTKRGRAWKEMENLPHFRYPVIVEEKRALAIVKQAEREVNERADTNRVLGDVPRHVLVIDELWDLVTGNMGQEFTSALSRISKLGREFAVNLCVATQYPLVRQLGDSVAKQQMSMRLIGRMANSQAAQVATGQRNSGAASLTREGDFIRVSSEGMTRFQVAFPVITADCEETPDQFDPLPELEDFERPITKMGRPIEDLSPEIVGQLMLKGMDCGFEAKSFHTVGSWIQPRVSGVKAKRHWLFAERVHRNITEQGYALATIKG